MRPSGFRKAEEMMLRLGAALTTLFILLGSAGAGADPPGGLAPAACPAWKTAVLAVRASDPEARLLEVVQGKAASQFLDLVNAMPPVSHVGGDRVAVVFAPDADAFLFVVGEHGCATGILQVPRQEIKKMAGVAI
jgi:hypothetical protein